MKYNTIFYQGIFCSATHAAKYAKKGIATTTGQHAICKEQNNLEPIDVLIHPFFGTEIKDVNLHPFDSYMSYLNPLKLLTTSIAKFSNWYHGIEISAPVDEQSKEKGDLRHYALNLSEISVGQLTDIESHYKNYLIFKKEYPNNNLILYGVSRGAATTFNAFTEYKYPEVKLVVLEGCFHSLKDAFSEGVLYPLSVLLNTSLSFFTKYRHDGPSPATNVEHFPENVPVVFITSKSDIVVPSSSTKKLAEALAKRQKNDVYLLVLNHASHPNYVFHNVEDHDHYEGLIHAIYRKYNMPYIPSLAKKGEGLLKTCLLNCPEQKHKIKKF